MSPIINIGTLAPPWGLPTYTGSAEIHGTKERGYIILKSSGILKFPGSGTVERAQTGSGLAGATAGNATSGTQKGGDGGYGGGMWYKPAFKVVCNKAYQITIAGACSSNSDANITTSFGGSTTTYGRGAAGGSGGQASSATQSDADDGAAGNKRPWNGNNPLTELGSFCAGGGGGAAWLREGNQFYEARAGTGGSPGGGTGGHYSTSHTSGNGYDAEPNTASGGGGGGRHYGDSPTVRGSGGKGGSGIVIVRWGYV